MAQFRTTADYVDAVLNRAGEPTSGTSSYESDALTELNKIHHALHAGGLIFEVNIDDDWTWARSRHPYTIELQAPITTGTVTMTESSDGITFSSAPSVSVAGWFLRVDGETTVYRIASHTAASTSADIDAFYVGSTGSGKSYTLFKLDYELVPSHIYIESGINDRLDFVRSGTTELNASLTAGAYTPSALATHIASVVGTAAGGTSTYGCTYDSVTRKFTLTSNRQGGDVFYFKWATGTNAAVRSAGPSLGFDYTDGTNAASHESAYVLGGVSRLCSPVRAYRGGFFVRDITIIDNHIMQEDFPVALVTKGLPRHAAIVRENADGLRILRFDRYPNEKMKVEVPVIEIPLDLKDNAVSSPRLPRKYSDVLEYGAAYHIMLAKADDKAGDYSQIAAAQLKLMQAQHRAQLTRTDADFGRCVPRPDLTGSKRRLRYGYTADDSGG